MQHQDDPLSEAKAEFIVNTLLEAEGYVPPPAGPWSRRVRVRKPNGEVVPGDWTGYYDMREFGGDLQHSIALHKPNETRWSHGMLPPGHEILDELPSYEEWRYEKEARDRNLAAKSKP